MLLPTNEIETISSIKKDIEYNFINNKVNVYSLFITKF